MSQKEIAESQIYAYLSGSWVDLTPDTITDHEYQVRWGITGNGPLDRLADTGSMEFTLNNKTGKYSPGNAAALAGWKKGVFVKLVITYDGLSYIRFRGQIDSLRIEPSPKVGRKVYVTVLDWMDYAAKYPLVSPGYQANKRADEALVVIVPAMPIQPQETSYDVGNNTFPALFDTVTTHTRAYTEFSKLALSEVGYIYLRKTKATGEQLVFENNNHRNGLHTLDEVPVCSEESGRMLMESGSYLLLETGDKIILDQTQTVFVDDTMAAIEISYGRQLANRVSAVAYPKRIDTSAQVLYSLSTAMMIGANQTIVYRGNYSDPIGGATVNAISTTMIAPVATTDYLMNTASGGTGTNVTANLSVTAVYGTEGVTYTLTSDYTAAAYITKLQARGTGVYQYNPIEVSKENSVSYNEYGYSNVTIQQQYQRDLFSGETEASKILDRDSQPRTTLDKVVMVANSSSFLMEAMLSIDVGSLVRVKETQSGSDGYYYVQGVEISIMPGKVISFAWVLRQAFSLAAGLSLISTQFYYSHTTDVINYGYLPTVSNQTARCDTAWIYISDWTGKAQSIIRLGGRYAFYTYDGGNLFYQRSHETTSAAYYSSGTMAAGAWYHVAVTRDESGTGLAAAKLYINGVSQTITTLSAPVGLPQSIEGAPLTIGNIYDNATPLNGLIKDVRIYNRILTAAEIAAIYAEGAGGTGVTSGMIFQGPVVHTGDLAYFTDHTLLSTDRLLDNIYGAIGKPSGSPITRLP